LSSHGHGRGDVGRGAGRGGVVEEGT
jgi:hypothetical protein